MSKKKKQLESFKSELHSISPLPVEMVVERLRTLERKDRLLYIEVLSEDEFGFAIRSHRRGSLSDAQVLGTVWRWNGTYTRIDVDSSVDIMGQWIDVALQIIGLILAMILISPFFWFFGEIFPQLLFNPPVAIGLAVVALGLVFAVMWIVVRITNVDLLVGNRYRALRDIDSVMQAIADKLSENLPEHEAVLEFDGSETSLAFLLDSDKYQHLRMGEDGEVED
jgi:hypothetical protein